MYRVRPTIVAAGLVLAATPAAGQSLCVECLGPDRSYSCSIKDSERAQNVRGAQRAQEFVCISEIARVGGHRSCRVSTSYSGPCMGQPMELDLAKIGTDAVVIGRPPEGEPGGNAAGVPAATPVKKGPPQTLEELARQTVAKSKEQMNAADDGVKKAGDAVGGAMKKTWDCVTSLFNRC